MRTIRVKAFQLQRKVLALKVKGFFAQPTPLVPWAWHGSTDTPHPGVKDNPQDWGAILTDCSGKNAHKIWKAAGLL